ncbi:hypothetical protein Tco_0087164 [Tanacetum coccineum]
MGFVENKTRWRRESAASTVTIMLIEFNTIQNEGLMTRSYASIEQTSDLDDISLDEITGKLKAFEERIKLRKGGQVESQENLLFTHGEHSGKGRRFSKRRGTGIQRSSDTGVSLFLLSTLSVSSETFSSTLVCILS